MTLIFGHRGAAGHYPENTMLSFEAAKAANADGIELDVQMTRDGELVVIHDETVDRTTNGMGFVKDFNFEEISRLDASYKFSQYKGSSFIPTLNEVLEWAKRQRGFIVNIELKNGIIDYPKIEEKTIKLIYKHSLQKQVIISSFNHYSLVTCKEISSEIETAILYMEGLYLPWKYAESIGAKGLHPHYHAAKGEIISQSQGHGISVRPFTINDKQMMQRLINEKCAGFFTDFPETAVDLKRKGN
ncbi:glycerophosphodiester phosphodiesterase [Metabacillus bambusae]|uniref:Glycerophosphodiester phosphodiesterase n=1 Tax=Metabacillus bambusae TaxID=2795218 RepID=A0ABS3N9A0_9BACI|nr:glycerophosphodiester phosphodiesterase [Metabacillus bambusae]MBO1514630.1 glycerophosphodiester phosphodiesterase [Metabacillus bambusae]